MNTLTVAPVESVASAQMFMSPSVPANADSCVALSAVSESIAAAVASVARFDVTPTPVAVYAQKPITGPSTDRRSPYARRVGGGSSDAETERLPLPRRATGRSRVPVHD